MNPESDLEMVAHYDAILSGAYRPRFWAQLPSSHVVLVVNNSSVILGVGAVRPLKTSTRLGPIYAKSASIASAIVSRY